MPNWTYNKIKCNKKIAEKLLDKKDNKYILDFNKLIPMPETLKITAGTIEDKAVASYYLSLDKKGRREIEDLLDNTEISFYNCYWKKYQRDIIEYMNNPIKLKEIEDSFNGKLADSDLTFNSLADLGKQYIDNIKEHGCSTWYDWSVRNWGTKWNVLDEVEVEIDQEEYNISFRTAWSVPVGIVEKYSELCSDKEFYWEYEDEEYDGQHILQKEDGVIYQYVLDIDRYNSKDTDDDIEI